MNGSRKKLTAAVAAASVMLFAGACSRPDPNPDVRITGDRTEAIPETTTTTSTTTEAPATTTYYGPDGAGVGSGAEGVPSE